MRLTTSKAEKESLQASAVLHSCVVLMKTTFKKIEIILTKKNLTDTFATTFITICKKVATAESAIGGLRSCRKGAG